MVNSNAEAVPAETGPVAGCRTADFLELTKPGITFLVVTTAVVSFYLSSRSAIDIWRLLHTLAGTALVAAGASALNMYVERELDSRMRRTARRPLPMGRLQPEEALVFALALAVAGMVYLFALVNPLTGLLSAITLVSYLFLYTPLKTRTWLCTLIGAAPGALPVIMGWAAANGRVDAGAWALFAVVFLWQLPHFYAIGWMYREDYARAGFSMLPVIDASGTRTSRQIGVYILLLIGATFLPFAAGVSGVFYLAGAAMLDLIFLYFGGAFVKKRDRAAARRVFFYTITYLPLLLALLIADRILG
jgi:protoheme IX farnesyltransferase